MHLKDFGKLFSAILDSYKRFIEDETEHPVGKINLGFVLLFVVTLVAGFIPLDFVLLYRVIVNNPVNEMEFFMPLFVLISIIIFGYLSLRLIPPKPPRNSNLFY